MEYCIGNPRKFIQTEKGTRGKEIFFMEKYRDLLERASHSISPAHNRKWEGKFHKTIMGPKVTMLLGKRRISLIAIKSNLLPKVCKHGNILSVFQIYRKRRHIFGSANG